MNRQQKKLMLKEIQKTFQSRVKLWGDISKQKIGKSRSDVFKNIDFFKLKRHTIGDEITELDAICTSVTAMYLEWVQMGSQIGYMDKVNVGLKILKETKFNNEIEKKLFTEIIIADLDFKDINEIRTTRLILSQLIHQSWSDYEKMYLTYVQNRTGAVDYEKTHTGETVSGKEWEKEVYDDFDYLKENEYITVYRGFNTRNEKNIRLSNDKRKQDYYRQNESSGLSYSLHKYIAFAFSYRYQDMQLQDFLKSNVGTRKDFLKHYEKIVGRATIGRYVVKSKDVKIYTNYRNEREVIINDRSVRLIDYKFVSNKDLEISLVKDVISASHKVIDLGKVLEKRNHWLSKNWKSDIKITKQIKDLF